MSSQGDSDIADTEQDNQPLDDQRTCADVLSAGSQLSSMPGKTPRRGRIPALLKLPARILIQALGFIKGGVCPRVAFGAQGIPESTFYMWMKKGRDSRSGLLREFFLQVVEAEMESRVLIELKMRQDYPRFWLERRFSEDYGSGPARIQIDGQVDVDHEHRLTSTAPDAEIISGALGILQQLGAIEIKSLTTIEPIPTPTEADTIDVISSKPQDDDGDGKAH